MFQSTRPRGARQLLPTLPKLLRVSIHAPTWGATICCVMKRRRSYRFNPRAHVGRDCSRPKWQFCKFVSIHAPTWGATVLLLTIIIVLMFQSTRPRGARRKNRSSSSQETGFNPRAHVGRDMALIVWFGPIGFQSTRPRGARPFCQFCRVLEVRFNPRAHVGRDMSLVMFLAPSCSFNPRAHVGRDTE